MVSEHTEQGFPPELIGDTFGLAYFGNGMVAIGAGVVAEVRRQTPTPPSPGRTLLHAAALIHSIR